MRGCAKWLVLAALLGAAGLAPGAARAGVSVLGGLTHEFTLEAGEAFEGTIELQNSGDGPEEVRLYQTDYRFAADGSNEYGIPGASERSNAAWIRLNPSLVTVPPGGRATAHFTGRVPRDAALKGSYWSMIMVEPRGAPASANLEAEEGKVTAAVRTLVRYGVQVVVSLGGSGVRKLAFADKRIAEEDGRRLFVVDLANTGERWLSPTVWIELYDGQGAPAGRFESSKKRLFPGCSVRHWLDLTGVAPGDYRALVVADNGDESVFGAQYTLSLGR